MKLSVSAQMMEFIYSALFGVCIGVFYDALAIIRSYIKPKKVITVLFDILFWIISIAALLAFVLLVTDGKMRWYVLVGTFLGIFLYKNTISGLFFCAIRSIISVCIKVLHILVRPLYAFSDWTKVQFEKKAKRKRKIAGKETEHGEEEKKA